MRIPGRTLARLVTVVVLVLSIFPVNALAHFQPASDSNTGQIEPGAGAWKTWLLTSGSQYRAPAPPDAAATQAELAQLRNLAGQRDAAALQQIAYWNTGSPAYRWDQIAINENLKTAVGGNRSSRNMALLNAAIYDGTIAAWDSKYTYNRSRPGDADSSLPAVATPRSPSYPSEYAVTAAASAAVLAYIFPQDADYFNQQVDSATQSRLLAGVEYPSDVQAGLALGRAIGALAVARGKADNSDAKWDGTMPTGPGHWTGANPIEPLGGTWKTWVLSSGSQLRPGPPPAYDSAQEKADLAELKNYKRTPASNAVAFFWQYGAGPNYNTQYWFQQSSQSIAQAGLDDNPPLAARAYALLFITSDDTTIACWDGKYAYWAIRPFQLDPTLTTLFPTPNHPSYPAAHGCNSGSEGAIMGYLFPNDAANFTAIANQAGESRIWAGIHFRTDVTTGLALGRSVAALVIDHANHDGSQPAGASASASGAAPGQLADTASGSIVGTRGGAFANYQIDNSHGAGVTLTLTYTPFDAGQANAVGFGVYQNGKHLGDAMATVHGGAASITVPATDTGGPILIQVFNYGTNTISYTLSRS